MPADKKRKFSQRTIEAIVPPTEGRECWYDSVTRGLCVFVYSTGRKIFFWYRKVNGKPERVRIGDFPTVSVEQARRRCDEHNGAVADGTNPAEDRRTRRNAWTLEEAFGQFIEAPTRTRAKRPRSPVTIANYRYLFDNHLAPWAKRLLSSFTRQEIERFHDSIGRTNGQYLANRILSLVKAVFEFAIDRQGCDVNPAARLPKFEETSRERFLQPDELGRFFQAVDAEPSEKIRDFVYLALWTGQRRGSLLAMRWDDVALTRAIWTIPKTKSGRPLDVVLSVQAVDILTRRFANRGESAYVFPGHHGAGHLTSPDRQWRDILKRAGIENLRIHDLRRSLASWQAATGASSLVIGRSLGHSTPEATRIYARLNLDPVREAVSRATEAILAAGKTEDK